MVYPADILFRTEHKEFQMQAGYTAHNLKVCVCVVQRERERERERETLCHAKPKRGAFSLHQEKAG
jgi:hypothetical protein